MLGLDGIDNLTGEFGGHKSWVKIFNLDLARLRRMPTVETGI